MTRAKLDRLSWLLYDFANNSFPVMIVTFVYPVYFKSVVCAGLVHVYLVLQIIGVGGAVLRLEEPFGKIEVGRKNGW